MLTQLTYTVGKQRFLEEQRFILDAFFGQNALENAFEVACDGYNTTYIVESKLTYNQTHVCDIICVELKCKIEFNTTSDIVYIRNTGKKVVVT